MATHKHTLARSAFLRPGLTSWAVDSARQRCPLRAFCRGAPGVCPQTLQDTVAVRLLREACPDSRPTLRGWVGGRAHSTPDTVPCAPCPIPVVLLLPCEVCTRTIPTLGRRKQPQVVCSFPTTAVTKDHNLSDLEHQAFIALQFWKSEVCSGFPWATIEVMKGWCSLWRPEGEFMSLSFLAAGGDCPP